MKGSEAEFEAANKQFVGRRVRLIGSHPFAGYSAEVMGFDNIGMKVKLIHGDAMDGHESYVMKREHYRVEREGMDW